MADIFNKKHPKTETKVKLNYIIRMNYTVTFVIQNTVSRFY